MHGQNRRRPTLSEANKQGTRKFSSLGARQFGAARGEELHRRNDLFSESPLDLQIEGKEKKKVGGEGSETREARGRIDYAAARGRHVGRGGSVPEDEGIIESRKRKKCQRPRRVSCRLLALKQSVSRKTGV